ncbi:sensitivity to red-light reduced protein, partial [Tilletia horrida]
MAAAAVEPRSALAASIAIRRSVVPEPSAPIPARARASAGRNDSTSLLPLATAANTPPLTRGSSTISSITSSTTLSSDSAAESPSTQFSSATTPFFFTSDRALSVFSTTDSSASTPDDSDRAVVFGPGLTSSSADLNLAPAAAAIKEPQQGEEASPHAARKPDEQDDQDQAPPPPPATTMTPIMSTSASSVAEAAVAAAAAAAAASADIPMRVLLVDDNPLNLALLLRLLHRRFAEQLDVEQPPIALTDSTVALDLLKGVMPVADAVRVATPLTVRRTMPDDARAKAAANALDNPHPSFTHIMLDIHMPAISGLSLARRIRGLPSASANRDAKLLACTTAVRHEEQRLYRAGGFDGLIE